MPTRLGVMLHRRRSARAGEAAKIGASETASAARRSARLAPREPGMARARRIVRSADKADPAVIDVRSGRSGDEKVAQRREESRRIVVGEKGCGIKAGGASPCQGRLVDERSRGVRRLPAAAVGAV